MLETAVFVALAVLVSSLPAFARPSLRLLAREAKIRAAVPYAAMAAQIPTLTPEAYDGAVRTLAEQELGEASTLTGRSPGLRAIVGSAAR